MIFNSDSNKLNETTPDVLLVPVLKCKACIFSSLESNDSLTSGFAIGVLSNLDRVFNHTKAVEELIYVVICY